MKGVTLPDDEARRVFDVSIERGVNLIDTAHQGQRQGQVVEHFCSLID